MQLPAKQTRVAARLHTPKFSCGCVRAYGRTGVRAYGRTVVWMDKSDVITKPKFLAFTGYQILLAMGLRTHASGVRSSAKIKIVSSFCSIKLCFVSNVLNNPAQSCGISTDFSNSAYYTASSAKLIGRIIDFAIFGSTLQAHSDLILRVLS